MASPIGECFSKLAICRKAELSHEPKLVKFRVILSKISCADSAGLKLKAMAHFVGRDFDYLFFEKRTADVNFQTARPSTPDDSSLHFKFAIDCGLNKINRRLPNLQIVA